jgi:hypothetical protein
MMKIR